MDPALSGTEDRRAGHRERSKDATRRRLLDSAIRLFAERGYDQTSMDEIAEAAGVARATAFNYFPRKRAFLEAWGKDRRDTIRAALAAQDPALPVAVQLANAFALYADHFEQDAGTNRRIHRYCVLVGGGHLSDAKEYSKPFAEALRAGQQRGDIRTDVDADACGLLLLDIAFAALTRWATNEDPEPGALKRHLTSGLQVVLAGLSVVAPRDGATSLERRL